MKVKSVKPLSRASRVYDITVDGVHCFSLENGAIAHNSVHFLGVQQQTFEDVLGRGSDFSYIPPGDAAFYAASDALMTLWLARETIKFANEAKTAYELDRLLIIPFLLMTEERTRIDPIVLSDHRRRAVFEANSCAERIFSICGRNFELNSPKQVGDALKRMGLDTGILTDTEQMSTSSGSLSKLDHELAQLIVKYREWTKLLNTYIEPLMDEYRSKGGSIPFHYNFCIAPTGRLSGGKSGKNTYFGAINIQSIAKPHATKYYCERSSEYSGEAEFELLGWKFTKLKISNKLAEGSEIWPNIRAAFVPEPGHLWVSLDYCISPESTVETRNGEHVPIKSLEGRELDIKTPNGYERASNFRYTGKKKKCILKLKSGKTLICSPDHRILVKTQDDIIVWKELKNILPTDSVEEDCISQTGVV